MSKLYRFIIVAVCGVLLFLIMAALTGCAALTSLYTTTKTDVSSPAGQQLVAVAQAAFQVGLNVAAKNPAGAVIDGIQGAASAMRDYEGLPTAPSAATVAQAAAVGSGVAVVAKQVAPQLQTIISVATSKGLTTDQAVEAAAKGLDAVAAQVAPSPSPAPTP